MLAAGAKVSLRPALLLPDMVQSPLNTAAITRTCSSRSSDTECLSSLILYQSTGRLP